jgi:Flp pilus assembly protein CpaB
MFWGTEIFRAHAAGKEERMKAARRAISTSCDLVTMSNGFVLPNGEANYLADIKNGRGFKP